MNMRKLADDANQNYDKQSHFWHYELEKWRCDDTRMHCSLFDPKSEVS